VGFSANNCPGQNFSVTKIGIGHLLRGTPNALAFQGSSKLSKGDLNGHLLNGRDKDTLKTAVANYSATRVIPAIFTLMATGDGYYKHIHLSDGKRVLLRLS
jgi:hypothetical protein